MLFKLTFMFFDDDIEKARIMCSSEKNSVFIVARKLSPNRRVTFLKGFSHMFKAVSYVTVACLIFSAFVERKELQYIQEIPFFLSRVLMDPV